MQEINMRLVLDSDGFRGELRDARGNVLQFGQAADQAGTTAAKGLKRTEDQARQTAGALNTVRGAIAEFGRGVAQGIGQELARAIRSLPQLAMQSVNLADQLSKMSQKVGISIESLSTLGYAADRSGVGLEQLEAAMVRLAVNASAAARGTGESKAAFEQLGISVTDNNGRLKSTDTLVREVAQGISQLGGGMEKTNIAVKLFGDTGAKLIPLLDQGGDGIAALEERARSLGLELDANTGRSAEQFNDLLADLGSLGTGVGNEIARQLLPSMTQLVAQFVDAAREGDGLKSVATAIADVLRVLAAAAFTAKAGIEAVVNIVAASIDVMDAGARSAYAFAQNYTMWGLVLPKTADDSKNLGQILDELKTRTDAATSSAGTGLSLAVSDLTDKFEALFNPTQAAAEGITSTATSAEQASTALTNLQAGLSQQAAQLEQQVATFGRGREGALEYAQGLEIAKAATIADAAERAKYVAGVKAAFEPLLANARALDAMQAAQKRGQETQRAAQRDQRELTRELERAETAQLKFKDELLQMEAAMAGPVRTAQIDYQRQLEDLDLRLEAGEIQLIDYYKALELVEEGYERSSEAARQQEDVVGRLSRNYAEQARLAGLSADQRRIEVAVAQALAAEEQGLAKLSEEQRAAKIALIRATVEAGEQSVLTAERSREAADLSAQAWQDFAEGLVDAVSKGGEGVKAYFKRLLQDLLRQWASSALLRSMASFFGGSMPGVSAAANGGNGYVSQLSAMFGGGSSSGGTSLGGSGYGSMVNSGLSWLGNSPAAQQVLTYAPYAAAAGGAYYGLTNRGGSTGSGGSLAAGAAYGYAGYALGTVATGALLGAGAGAATGVAGAAAGGALAGGAGAAAAIPVVGWIVAALALIDAFSGGKLFGTRYKPDEMTTSIGIEGGEAFTESSLTEVRNRSLFRGRQWRNSTLTDSPEAVQAAQALFDAADETQQMVGQRLRGQATELMDVAIRSVTDFDSKGRPTTTKIFVDLLGRTFEEASQELAGQRISAEFIIDAIDQIMGNVVPAVAASTANAARDGMEQGIEGSGAFDQVGEYTAMVIKSATAGVQGEASALAERWRGDAEQLLAGAQFLLDVASDIRSGFDLLETGTLTPVLELVEDLAVSGETLGQTYARLAAATQLMEQSLELSGVTLDRTREAFVRFSVDFAEAAGGLQRAQSLTQAYVQRFYSPDELLDFDLGQARTEANRQFGGIGLDLTQFTGEGGLARFRELFEQQIPTLGAEALVQWYEAASALGVVVDLEAQRTAGLRAQAEAAAEAEAQRVADLASLMSNFREQAFSAAIELAEWDLSPLERALSAIDREMQEAIQAASALGASEAELAEIRAGFATQSLLAQRRVERELGQLLDGLRFDDAVADMSQHEQQIARINRQFDNYIAQALAMGASEEQLAEIREIQARQIERVGVSAQGAADAIGRAGDQLRRIREFGADIRSSIAALGDDLRAWINQLTGYSPEVQGATATLEEAQAEIRRRFAQQQSALQAERASLLRELLAQGWDEEGGGSGLISPTIRVLLGQLSAVDAALQGLGGSLIELEEYAAVAFAARQRSVLEGLRAWRDGLLQDTQLSVLTPAQQFADIQRQYEQTLSAAQAGDLEAQQALQGVAQSYLQQAREWFASGQQYTDIFARVLADTGDLLGELFGTEDTVAQALRAIADSPVFQRQTSVLESILDVLRGGTGALPSYDVGTAFVPSTGPAVIHRGEAILPASVSDFARRSGLSIGPNQGNADVVAELRALRTETARGHARLDARLELLEQSQTRASERIASEQRRAADMMSKGSTR